MQRSELLKTENGDDNYDQLRHENASRKDKNARRKLETMTKKVERYCEQMKKSGVPNKHVRIILKNMHILTELLLFYSSHNER
jgi:thioredoxin-related protein